MKRIILIILAAVQALSFQAVAKVTLPALFSDNMVLQRNSSPIFRGTASPGKEVTVFTSWDSKTYLTVSSQTGDWSVKVATPEAGGPYTITFSDGEDLTLGNVLIGEVWFCGGQSNMEFSIGEKVIGWTEALAEAASFDKIRLLHLKNWMSPRPTEEVKVVDGKSWEVCSAESIRDFSAAGYYFGKELYQALGIPIGLIQGCWGGTEIEGWISPESLSQVPAYKEKVERLSTFPADPKEREVLYGKELEEWIASADAAEKEYLRENALRRWKEKGFNDSAWPACSFPGWIQDQVPLETVKNGIYYCRKSFTVPRKWAGKNLELYFSSIDDRDVTFFNGVEIGRGDYYLDKRTYRIPAKLVKEGEAVISVRIVDNAGKCSIAGENGQEMYVKGPDGEKISLAGTWKFKMPEWLSDIPDVPYRTHIGPNIPSYLYNAIIHPARIYPVKGVIWYQGEANLGFSSMYGDLMTLLVQDWRKAWGLTLDFYICNLHNYIETFTEPTKSRYAELREVQTVTARNLEHCGEAILIDVGDPYDTHPKNKAAVGHRLALQALGKSYGQDIVCDSPYYKDYHIEGREIRLTFTCTAGGLKTYDGQEPRGFAVAGPDRVFHKAKARIEGEEIIVECPAEVEFPLSVRYAWHDNPDCNLVNGAGLPCGSFRTDKWEFEKE